LPTSEHCNANEGPDCRLQQWTQYETMHFVHYTDTKKIMITLTSDSFLLCCKVHQLVANTGCGIV